MQRLMNRKLYYGWVVVWVVFAALLVSAGVRAAPTVLINPLESELGWGRAAISAAISIGLLLYGLDLRQVDFDSCVVEAVLGVVIQTRCIPTEL